jgi:hypothetical protein
MYPYISIVIIYNMIYMLKFVKSLGVTEQCYSLRIVLIVAGSSTQKDSKYLTF